MLTILLEDSDRSPREVEGVISDADYYGDLSYYEVKLPGTEAPATVTMRNTAGRRILRAGMAARVGWSPEAIMVLE